MGANSILPISNKGLAFLSAIIFCLSFVNFNAYSQAAGETCGTGGQCDSGLYCYNSKCQKLQDNNAFSRAMCRVLEIATGTGGKAFAAFAIISVGIGFFTGKVSWGLMIGVAAGIAAIFGAPSIVAAISGKDAGDCTGVA
jgi:type IV secretory pathway VirB2 component (pilin)